MTATVATSASRPRAHDASVLGVRLSHPDRVLDPPGITKRELATYYALVARWMVPHVRGRPLTLLRWANGQHTAKGGIYLRHAKSWGPKELRRVRIQERTKVGEYLIADTPEALIALAQMDILEIHTWNATIDRIERPDRIVFDLDPDESLPWSKVAGAAKLVRDGLAAIGLESWLKTTGGKGLHVVVPLAPRAGWDEALEFSRSFSEALARVDRTIVTTMSKSARHGKIFVDYLRNVRAGTSVAAFSTRARPGAPVSLPIAWDEIDQVHPKGITMLEAARRVARWKKDPWAGYWKCKQRLPRGA